MKKLLVAMSISAAFALSACSDPCVDMCEEAKECSGATEEEKSLDCAKSCEDRQKNVEEAGCETQYEKMMDCAADLDVCADAESNKCEAEGLAVGLCMLKYCMDKPERDFCKGE
ncbi:MAG: hypothetical protein ACOX6T_24555 [Myxococcales bacterium]